MSDTWQGSGWWQTSDGKWHSPTPSKSRHATTSTATVAHASAKASTEDATAENIQRTRRPSEGAATARHEEEQVQAHCGGSTAIGHNGGNRIGKFAELVSGSWLDHGCADGGYTQEFRAHSGGSTAIGCNVGYRIGKFAELVSGSWLDFGCADGGYTQELLRVGAKQVTGVDVEPEHIAAAKARELPDTSFEVIDGLTLPYEDGAFDGAFVNEVMEHVVDEEAALGELHRVIRPGGVVVVISPNRWFPYEGHGMHIGSWRYRRPALFLPWLPRRISDHFVLARNYWPKELAGLVEGAGFRIERPDFVWPVLEVEEYNWLPRRVSDWYRTRLNQLDSLPVVRRLGLSTMVVGRRAPDGERRRRDTDS